MTETSIEQIARIVAIGDDIQPIEFMLTNATCDIGRSSICHIIVQRSVVSRMHARIERAGLRYTLHDSGSANGTFVNNRRVLTPHLLQDHDQIGLGAATPLLRFVDPDPTFVPSNRLHYDDQNMQFFLDDHALDLPPAQFRLLVFMYQHIGELCTREQCARAMWGREYHPSSESDALDRAVSNLRTALRQIDSNAHMIKTRRGVGYVLMV